MTRSLAIIVVFCACSPSYADEPPAKRFERDMVARLHMHESYELYSAIERLLTRGKLDAARDLAHAIGIAPDEAGLSPWAKQMTLVRERANAVANATSLDDAIRRVGSLAAACASCHVLANATPELRVPPAIPTDRPTVEARMARHLWGITRVREGMIAGLGEPWRAGLDVLADARAPWQGETAQQAALSRRLREVAAHARTRPSESIDDRAVSYSELLTTCASCHTTRSP